METKFIKSAIEKRKAAQAAMHISPVAGTLFVNIHDHRRARCELL